MGPRNNQRFIVEHNSESNDWEVFDTLRGQTVGTFADEDEAILDARTRNFNS